MNIDNHSIKQSLASRSERSLMDTQSKSITPCSKTKLDRSSSPIPNKKHSTPLDDSSTNAKKTPSSTPSQDLNANGVFKVAGIEFRYSIKDGERHINDMPAKDFMATLSHAQMLAIVHAAVIKSKLDD